MRIIKSSNHNSVQTACDFLKEGKVVSFATDTVYGLAVDATNQDAVEKLFNIKNRNKKNPIAIFVKDLKTAEEIFIFDETAKKIASKFLPGSLTLVLRTDLTKKLNLAQNLNQNNGEFLGFRIVDDSFITQLLEKFNGILAVSSANPSGKSPATNAQEVEKYFLNSDLDLLIDSGKPSKKQPSTVAKIDNNQITVLRQGPINID